MGSKKTVTKNEPPAWAVPSIMKGLDATNQVFDENQPRLADMSKQAYDAFNALSPEAFQSSPAVQSAQNTAQALGGGALLGANPGQSTYARLQGAGSGDPSMGMLSRMASSSGAGPGDGFAKNVAQGNFLNAQPTSRLYQDTLAGKYLDTENPYLESMVTKARQGALTDANRLFASRGMGTGMSTPFAKVAAGAVADAENNLRFQNYEAERGRQMQAAGMSDSVWGGERGRMDAAAQNLNENDLARRAQQLAAAQALGGQFSAGEDRALEAARAGDSAQQSQVQQMLTALGLTGDLRAAEYEGIAPALSLLNTAADLPYVGVGALNGNIRTASNGYGTSTSRTSGGLGSQLLGAGAQLGSGYLMGGR